MSKEIFVHIDLKGKPFFVGRLWVHNAKGRESASFEYSSEWRSSPVRFSLEPALAVGEGSFHTDKALFGSMGGYRRCMILNQPPPTKSQESSTPGLTSTMERHPLIWHTKWHRSLVLSRKRRDESPGKWEWPSGPGAGTLPNGVQAKKKWNLCVPRLIMKTCARL